MENFLKQKHSLIPPILTSEWEKDIRTATGWTPSQFKNRYYGVTDLSKLEKEKIEQINQKYRGKITDQILTKL